MVAQPDAAVNRVRYCVPGTPDGGRQIRRDGPSRPPSAPVGFRRDRSSAPHQVPETYTEPYTNLKGKRRTYAGMLAAMDEGIGQIVAAVDETGRRDRTLFVFTSDNGGPNPGNVTDNGDLRAGKGTLYEGGVRVCAFASWQGKIKPGTTLDQPLHIADWYPTLLNLAGASLEQKHPLDGKDLWPCLTQGKPSPHQDILINAEPTRGAIRAGDWKLVISGGQRRTARRQGGASATPAAELYNLRDDPHEKNNLAEKHPEKLNALRARYDTYAKSAAEPKNKGEVAPKGDD